MYVASSILIKSGFYDYVLEGWAADCF